MRHGRCAVNKLHKTSERPCYLCTVEDGNETPFDGDYHTVCLLCAAKLRAMGRGEGILFAMGRWEIEVVTRELGLAWEAVLESRGK